MYTSEVGRPQVGFFAGPKSQPDRALRKWGETIEYLTAAEADVWLINEGGPYDGLQTFSNVRQLTPGLTQSVALEETQQMGAIRDFTGRFTPHEQLPSLNHPSVLGLVRNKHNLYEAMPELTANFLPVDSTTPAEDIGQFLHALPGTEAVWKPVTGNEGRGVVVASKAEIAAAAASTLREQPDGRFLLQERMDNTGLTEAIRGIDEAQHARLTRVAHAKELRLFAFRDVMVPVVRMNVAAGLMQHDTEDGYVYIDPDTVPEAAYSLGRDVMTRITAATGVKEVHAAVDLVNPGQETWRLLEANAKEPALPKRAENRAAANMVHGSLAAQLIRMASGQ